jgi:hypothetical protein
MLFFPLDDAVYGATASLTDGRDWRGGTRLASPAIARII